MNDFLGITNPTAITVILALLPLIAAVIAYWFGEIFVLGIICGVVWLISTVLLIIHLVLLHIPWQDITNTIDATNGLAAVLGILYLVVYGLATAGGIKTVYDWF